MKPLRAARPPWRVIGIKAALVALLCWVANPAAAQTVIITRADCSALVAHVPASGVEYAPGIDVRGRPVVPADLGGRPRLKMPDTVDIPVQIDMGERYGLPANSKLYELDHVKVGTARIRIKDGRAWFNGEPLTSAEHHAMVRACQKRGSGPTP